MSSALIRQDLVPMVVGYVLIMGALAIGLRLARRSARAEAAGADYLLFGPVFPTPSKVIYGPPLGLDKLKQVAADVKIPM